MLKDSPNIGTKTLTVKNDPRILPVGKVLRKTKINELPQLVNVFLEYEFDRTKATYRADFCFLFVFSSNEYKKNKARTFRFGVYYFRMRKTFWVENAKRLLTVRLRLTRV